MFVHLYHFRLMRCLIRKKVKGDHRIALTCADRKELVESKQVNISISYIVKVLTEGDKQKLSLSQFVLNELIRVADYADWNAFLRANPLPEGPYCNVFSRKSKKHVQELVEQRIRELNDGQVADAECLTQ